LVANGDLSFIKRIVGITLLIVAPMVVGAFVFIGLGGNSLARHALLVLQMDSTIV